VIIKGTSCAGASRLATHLNRTDTNERAEVKEVRGVVAENLLGALREMESVAAGARTTKPFYHGSINTKEDERLTDEQRTYAIDKLEAALGLTGQPRVVVVHEKEGREHCHIVWSRIDLDRMAAISDSHNYRKHEEVARALEKEFGLERVQGAHIEREGKERPARTPSHAEMLQAERTGVSPAAARALMTELWRETDSGKSFQAALETKWWVLARGDRRDFVAIDSAGGTHSVARRIEGAKAADVRERFADIDPMSLPSVAEAKKLQRDRQDERWVQAAMETDRSGVRPKAAKASMTALWHASHNGKTFQASLEQKWWVLARGDRGRFVAIDSAGGTHNLAHRIQGATGADIRQRFADIDPASLPSVAEARKLQQERQAERTQQAGASAAERARPDAGHARASVKPRERAAPVSGKAGAVASRLAGSVFSALMGEKPVPKEKESKASQRAKDASTPSQRRQELMRQLSREIPQETERDAEYEADKGRERSRG
jgi:Relaxase/Mobilisation nuclease domain